MTDLLIELEGSTYRWDDATGWRHMAGPEMPPTILPPVPASHVPDAAGFMAANADDYLYPWAVVEDPTPIAPEVVATDAGPVVY